MEMGEALIAFGGFLLAFGALAFLLLGRRGDPSPDR